MKVVLALIMACAAAAMPADHYPTKYDNLDIEEIANNDRLYQKYFDCLTSKGKCPPDGNELKVHLAEAIKTDCIKCSEKQKATFIKIFKEIYKRKPEDYSALEKIYDPEQRLRKKLSA